MIEIRQKVESLPANSIVVVGGAGTFGVSLAALTQLFMVPAKISPRSALVRFDDRTAIILFPTRTGCFLQIPQKHQEMLHPSFSITDQPSSVWIARCLIFDCGAK